MLVKLLLPVVRLITLLLVAGLVGAALVRLAPGFGWDESEFDYRLSAASRRARQAEWVHQPLLPFYAGYLARAAQGDWGRSRAFRRPVAELVADRWTESAALVGAGLLLGWLFALGCVVLPVLPAARWLRPLAPASQTILVSTPAALAAVVCLWLRWPPALAVAAVVSPVAYRYAERQYLRARRQPHLIHARALGLSRFRVLVWHALPGMLPALLAAWGVTVSLALGAAIPVEVTLGLPGLGELAMKAALARDLPLLVAVTLLLTALILLANALAETAGALLEPRSRRGAG